ncbi:MAG: DNA (cytosine-5-)-methyltransferase, partial [Enterococcus sp.]|nr:DNA (cytosine-5-)-methyltransferase [Enterococcus sp.]
MVKDKDYIRVAEMFAGVGGFRLGLEGYKCKEYPALSMPSAGPFKTVWANQWEPPGTEAKQFAWRCYENRFGKNSCINEDINTYLDKFEKYKVEIPDFDLLVGGFPCQDYSVAKPKSRSNGIMGKKGVLWWDILRMIKLKQPKYLLLENVDRLLKSPSSQRGRDFAVMLNCLAEQGYSIEWRVINAAEYGMPQRRRRVYIFGIKNASDWDLKERLEDSGILARAFPIENRFEQINEFDVKGKAHQVSDSFGKGFKTSLFKDAGIMQNYEVYTAKVKSDYKGKSSCIYSVVSLDKDVPEEFFI